MTLMATMTEIASETAAVASTALEAGKDNAGAFGGEAVGHLDALYNFALSLIRNEQDAADLVQETYLRALRFRHRFQPGTNLRAWLFRILRNAFIDAYWRGRRETVMADLEEGDTLTPASNGEQLFRRERGPGQRLLRLDLQDALEQLPEPFRTAILLSDVHGLSGKEITEIMGCPENTVKTRLFRGRRLLRDLLQDYHPEPRTEVANPARIAASN